MKDKLISLSSFICFVDDGSRDRTWDLLVKEYKAKKFEAIKLSNNFGHQNALLAGLYENKNEADIFVTIDYLYYFVKRFCAVGTLNDLILGIRV